ncbi:hypothetical protein [Akkermansia massiliensis]
MKTLNIILLAASFICAQAMGQPSHYLDKDLAKPRDFNVPEDLGKQSAKFKQTLDQGDLKGFYALVRPFFDGMNKLDRSAITREELIDQLWSFYFICGAPLYKVDVTTGDSWPYDDNDDLSAKSGVASFIYTVNIEEASNITGIPERQLKKLGAVYFSSIIKTLRDGYVHGFNEKVDKLIEQAFVTFKDDFHQVQNNQSNISIQQSRNNMIEFFIPTLEEEFVEMLVKYYPSHANEVIKYIKLAGYQDDEISKLIDRTVGRTSKTEYLYKGKIGREHDKRVKDTQKKQ